MSSKDELKRLACEAVDRHGDAIIDLGETILRNPETGFNEVKTAALVAQRMTALGLAPHTGLRVAGERICILDDEIRVLGMCAPRGDELARGDRLVREVNRGGRDVMVRDRCDRVEVGFAYCTDRHHAPW